MTPPVRVAALSAILLLSTACHGRGDRQPDQAQSVVWTDSVQLAVPESLAISGLGGLLVLADGGFVLSDAGSGHLLVFAPEGRLSRVIGKRGRGPSEMLVPASMALLGADTLAVTDNPTGRLMFFRLGDGAALGSVRLPGPTTDIARATAGLWMASPSLEANTTHALWRADSARVARGGSIPDVFTEFPRIARNLALPVLAARGDTVWLGFFGENGARRYVGPASTPDAVLDFPRVRRRGVPLDDRTWLQSEMSYEDELGAVSVMRALGFLRDGRVAVVHLDVTVQNDEPTFVGFLSALDPVTGQGCVDVPIPLTPAAVPLVHFTEDALYVVSAREDADGEPVFWLHKHIVSRC
jgi:hypothetical protein